MNTFQWTVCPLCGGNQIDQIGAIDYREPILFSTQEIELERTPLLFECRKCKSWFTQNIVPQELAFDMYQSGASSEKWADTPPVSEAKSAKIIARLDEHIDAGMTVLDVGANTGELLDHARSRGAVTFGVEPSEPSREVLLRKGHQLFPHLNEATGTFDVVTAFDLVEHLYGVPEFMRWVRDRLKPGGVLILLTGDNRSLSARLSRHRWWYLKAPEHVVFPSENYLAQTEGFRLINKDSTFASIGYKKSKVMQYLQYVRKSFFTGGYDGLPSLGPDHMLLTLAKTK
jgi:SAM-dependent methyltransferase